MLLSDVGVRLDSITYDLSWYNDATKEGGGYSIERINPNDPCSSNDNWSASTSINGGTPGQQNSIYDNSPDVLSPQIAQLIALSPNYLEIHFNGGMDSLSLSNAIISVSPTLTILPSASLPAASLTAIETDNFSATTSVLAETDASRDSSLLRTTRWPMTLPAASLPAVRI